MNEKELELDVGFEELILHINNAIKFIESEVNEDFDAIVDKSYESLEFVVGHIMGMRDAMVMTQSILQTNLFGSEEE
tara:strand:+ start:378 stop:608 length:231 start_codon:yes stop_codon:yes gene_type:complete